MKAALCRRFRRHCFLGGQFCFGYGLPWNTPEEEFIPDSLVYESKMALARAQLATQAPDCDGPSYTLPVPPMAGDQTGSM